MRHDTGCNMSSARTMAARVLSAAAAVVLSTSLAFAAGTGVGRDELRITGGTARPASASLAPVFHPWRSEDGRAGLRVSAPLGRAGAGSTGEHPAPAAGAAALEDSTIPDGVPTSVRVRLRLDSPAGLAGLILAGQDGEYYLAGAVWDREGVALDLSRSAGSWQSVARREVFRPQPGEWFWVELRLVPGDDGRRLELFAWDDGGDRPREPQVVAEEPADQAVVGLRPGLWAAGSGAREATDLLVVSEAVSDGEAASTAAQSLRTARLSGTALEVPESLGGTPLSLDLAPAVDFRRLSEASARSPMKTKDAVALRFQSHSAGYAEAAPGSWALLDLPPFDNDGDGAYNEDPWNWHDDDGDGRRDEDGWWGDWKLRWISEDGTLGRQDTGIADAAIVTWLECWSGRRFMGFATARPDGLYLLGYIQIGGPGTGVAWVGRGGQEVEYTLGPRSIAPIGVMLTESGQPLTDGRWFAREVLLDAVVTGGDGPSTVEARVDGEAYVLGTAYGQEGEHTFGVTATDALGATAQAAASFGIDLTPPSFSQVEPGDGAVLGGAPVQFTGRVSADAVLVTVAGVPASLGEAEGGQRPFTSQPVSLAEGPNTVAIHAEDRVGQVADLELHLDLDTLPPALAITSPADGSVAPSASITVTGTVSDAHLASVTVNGITATVAAGQWEATVPLEPGSNLIQAVAADVLGHTATASLSVLRDATPPSIHLLESGQPVAGPLELARPAVFTADVEDDDSGVASTGAEIDGAPYTLGTPYAEEGAHTLTVTATDHAGNQASVTATFTIDTTPPSILAVTPADGALVDTATLEVAGTVSADAAAVRVGGVTAALGAVSGDTRGFTAAGVPLAGEGPNEIVVEAEDALGNLASLTVHYTRDTLPPDLAVTSPEEGLVTGQPVLTVSGQVGDAHLDTLTVNGGPVAPAADGSFLTQLTLPEGQSTVTVEATDSLGHVTTVARSVTLDTVPPAISVTESGAPLADGLLVNRPVTPVIEVSDATALTTTVTLNGQPFVSGTAVSDEGSYLLSVHAEDAAGNSATVDLGFRIDLTAPVIAGLAPPSGTVTSQTPLTITGTADDAVSVTVAGQAAELASGVFTASGIVLAEGDNAVLISATDAAGNTGETTLHLVLDIRPPEVTLEHPASGELVGEDPVTVSGSAEDPHLESVTVNGRPAAVAGASFQAQVPLAGDGTHTLTVVATDAAGNASQAEVSVERDATPPQLSLSEPADGAVVGSAQVQVTGAALDAHLAGVEVNGRPVDVAPDGSFATSVTLAEGSAAITATARDSRGATASVTRTLTVDLSAPRVSLTAPEAGARLATATVTVLGTASDSEGLDRVTVNGREAVLAADGGFTLEELALSEGENTIIARAFDRGGNSGTASRTVTVDTVPPRVESLIPANGAHDVPPGVSLKVRFSEPVREDSLAGRVTLSSGGTPVPVTLTPEAGGGSILVRPEGGLEPDTGYVLGVAPGVQDLAGNPLAEGAETAFTTADTAPPAPPEVDPVPSPACFALLSLAGAAEPGATVEAAGSVRAASAVAGGDGRWSLELEPTVAERPVSVDLTAVDAAGNRSARTPLTVVLDCQRPHVVSAQWDGGTEVDVRLSEPPAEAAVAPGATVTLDGASGPLPFTAGVEGEWLRLRLAEQPPAEEAPLALALTSGVTDRAGNSLEPYTTLLLGGAGATLVSGEVYDAERNLPLAGATASLVLDGQPVTDPVVVTTDGRGRYQLPVTSSPVVVRLDAPGRLSAWRRVVPVPGASTVLFDARMPLRTEPVRVEGAATLESGSVTLTVPEAAVPQGGTEISLTAIPEQALPVLLPLGWTPAAAARVELEDGVSLDAPAVLELGGEPVTGAVAARLDETSLSWIAESPGSVVELTAGGTWVLAVPDPGPTAPGEAVSGSPLPAATAADPGELAASLTLDPPEILPMQTSTATVQVTAANAVPSGLPVEAQLDEVLHLVGGGVLVQPPAATDLVLYHREGGLQAVFTLGASEDARRLALEQGVKDIHIRPLPQTVRTENLIGPGGGSVLTADGLGLDVPAGALDHTVGVTLEPRGAGSLPAPVPEGLEPVAGATLELGGAELAVPAELSFPGEGLQDLEYLVLTPVQIGDRTVWRLAGIARLEGGRLVCREGLLPGLPVPWVRAGGLYLVARPAGDPWALIWGTVLGLDGQSPAANPCRVEAAGGLAALTGTAAAYAVAAPAGTVQLAAEDLVLFNSGGTSTSAGAGDHLGGVDIPLLMVAPQVVATSPAHGADHVSATTPVIFDLSEPLDPATVAGDTVTVQVIAGSAPAQQWEGALELAPDGTRLTWTPGEPFPPASVVRATLSGTVSDLQGYRLGGDGSDVTLEFGVERFLVPGEVHPERIRLYAPGVDDPAVPQGYAAVKGGEGAVPPDVWLYVENRDRQAATTTVAAGQDGSLLVPLAPWDGASGFAVGDHVLLHILGSSDAEDELGVVPLSVWLNADGSGGLVGQEGGDVATESGLTVQVPAGALPDGTMVTAEATDPATVEVELPDWVEARGAVRLELSAEASSGLGLLLPAGETGVTPPADPSRELILAKVLDVGGRAYPSMVGRAVWDPEAGAYRSLAGQQPAQAMLLGRGAEARAENALKSAGDADSCEALNGILATMTVLFLEPRTEVAFVAGSVGAAGAGVVLTGGFASLVPEVAGAAYTSACPYDYINPVPADTPFQLQLLDPDTGFVRWEGGFDAPPPGFVELPEDQLIGDSDALAAPVAGEPFDIFAFKVSEGEQPLMEGVTAELDGETFRVHAGPGALRDGTRLALTNLVNGVVATGNVSADGGSVSLPAQAGDGVVLAIEGTLNSTTLPVTILMNRRFERDVTPDQLRDGLAIEVEGGEVPELVPTVQGAELRVAPSPGWTMGLRYTLKLKPELFQYLVGGSTGSGLVRLPFKVAPPHAGSPVFSDVVADSALESDILLLAARGSGLLAYDVSDPRQTRPLGSYPDTTGGGVAAVTTDGFGMVAALSGVSPQPVVLRLFHLADFAAGGVVQPRASSALSGAEDVAAGFLRPEVRGNTVAFTPAAGGEHLSVDFIGDPEHRQWTAVHVDTQILAPGHPVILQDGMSRRILWRGRAPQSGDLVIQRSDLAADVDENRPLVLRAHGETILYCLLQAGRVMAWRVTYDPATGQPGLELRASAENSAVARTLGDDSYQPCRRPASTGPVFFGRIAVVPRAGQGRRPLVVSATPYVGLLEFSQAGDGVTVLPTGVMCLRSPAGADLADVAAERVHWEDGSDDTVVAVVGHRRLEILRVTDAGLLDQAAGADLPFPSYRVALAIDPVARMVLVRDNAGHLAVYTLDRRWRLELVKQMDIPAGTGPLLVDPDTGLAWVGTTPVQYRAPMVQIVADADGDGILEPVSYLQPLGVPEARDGQGDRPPYLGWVMVRAAGVPEGTDTLRVKVEGLGPGGGVVSDHGSRFLPTGTELELERAQGLDLDDPSRHTFISKRPILLIADERARTGVWDRLTEEERAELTRSDPSKGIEPLCRNCDRDLDGDGVQDIPWGVAAAHGGVSDRTASGSPIELASSEGLRVTVKGVGSAWLSGIEEEEAWRPEAEVRSVAWRPSPPVGWRPSGEVRAAAAPNVELSTGTLQVARTDLELPAPGLDVSVGRAYRSGGISWGELGWGWRLDLGVGLLRPLPDGDVELQLAGGERYTFSYDGPGADGGSGIRTAVGVPWELHLRVNGGYVLRYPDGSYTEYDEWGYPQRHRDRQRRDTNTGSEIRYLWSAAGKLLMVEQANGLGTEKLQPRRITFWYGESSGLLQSVIDSTQRAWEYSYDAEGRLISTVTREVRLDDVGTTADVGESYVWTAIDSDADPLPALRQGGLLTEVRDAEHRRLVVATYGDDGRLTALRHGEVAWTVSYPEERVAEVRGTAVGEDPVRVERLSWDEAGRLAELRVGEGDSASVTQYRYASGSADPLPVAIDLPTAGTDEVTQRWWHEGHAEAPRRMWFNLERVTRMADTEGEEGPSDEPQVTRYEYKAGTDLVTRVELPGSRVWVIKRDASGNVVKVTDPEGRYVDVERDALGRVKTRTPAGWESYRTQYAYDDQATGCGELTRETSPTGNLYEVGAEVRRTWTWDARGNLLRAETPSSGRGPRVVQRVVNKLGWELERWVEGTAGAHVWRVYDKGGREVVRREGDSFFGALVTLEWTEAGLPKEERWEGVGGLEPGGRLTVKYSYGPMSAAGEPSYPDPSDGLLRGVSHWETGRQVKLRYDDHGRQVERSVWGNGQWLSSRVEYGRHDDLPTRVERPGGHSVDLVYDRFGRLIRRTDDLGRRVVRGYDEAGRVVKEGLQDVEGGWWREVEYAYNSADQVTERRVAMFEPPGDPGQARKSVTRYHYDWQRGLLDQVEGPEGLRIDLENDDAGRPWRKTVWDGPERLVELTTAYWPSGVAAEEVERPHDPGEGSPTEYSTVREYDPLGRLVREVRPGGHESMYGYDALGRLTVAVAPGENGPVLTEAEISALGTRARVRRTGASERWLTRDEDGYLLELEETGGASFSAEYDAAGRVREQHLPGGGVRRLFWNEDGTLAREVLEDGTTVNHRYDPAGRLIERNVTPSAGEGAGWSLSETYTYTPLDQVSHAADDLGHEVERRWDSRGLLLEETALVGGHGFTTTAAYDDNGALVGLTYPDGSEAEVERDALGRLRTLVVGGEPLWSAGYHGLLAGGGQLGPMQLTRQHTLEGLPAEVRAVVSGAEVYGSQRSYTDSLRVRGERRVAGSVSQWSLGHDAGHRAREWTLESSLAPGLPEEVVGAGRTAREENVSRSFAQGGYDDLVGQSLTSRGRTVMESFDIDLSTHRLQGRDGWSYTYGERGERRRAVAPSGEELTYHHDWGGRLLGVDNGAGEVAAFGYDPLGRRVMQRAGGVTRYRVPFGSQEVAEYVEDINGDLKLSKRLYWSDGVDHPVGYDLDADLDGSPETRYLVLADDLGTVQAVADSTGHVVESYVYRPDGSFRIFGADTTPPQLRLARIRPAAPEAGRHAQRLELVFSEAVQLGAGTLELRDAEGAVVASDWQASEDGRRWWLPLDPPLTEGETYSLYLSGLADLAGNPMAVAEPLDRSFTAPAPEAELVLPLGGEGEILAIVDAPEGLVLVAGSPVDPASLGGSSLVVRRAAQVVPGTLSLYRGGGGAGDVQGYEGRLLVWRPDDPGAYLPAEYSIEANLALADPAGHPIHGPPSGLTYLHTGQGDVIWSAPTDTPILTTSAVGNDRYFHARPWIDSIALYDYRARFYDPATSTFLELDPLGPVDSPNLYQAFGFDGLNVRDPWGYGKFWEWLKRKLKQWGGLGEKAEEAAEQIVDRSLPAAPDVEADPYGAREAAREIGLDPDQTARSRAARTFHAVRQVPVETAGKTAKVAVEAGKLYVENKAAEMALAAGGAVFRRGRRIRMAGGTADLPDDVAAGRRTLRGGFGRPAGLSDDVLKLTEQHLTSSGDTVLGAFPGYIEKAKARNASYFDIGKAAWDALGDDTLRWEANRYFLDIVADRGDRILLSIPKTKIGEGTWLAREVQYLTKQRGYRWVNQWSLRPGG